MSARQDRDRTVAVSLTPAEAEALVDAARWAVAAAPATPTVVGRVSIVMMTQFAARTARAADAIAAALASEEAR